MSLLMLFLMTAGLVWLAVRLGLRFSDRTLAVIVRGFTGWRDDSWPRGVQEEDCDRPWGRSTDAKAEDVPPAKPVLTPVEPAIHAR